MLVEIGLHKWMCDECKKIEICKRLPKGWIFLDRNFIRKEIEHHCQDCKKDNKKDLK